MSSNQPGEGDIRHWPDLVIHEAAGPSGDLTDAFARVIKPMVSRIQNNENESRTLAAVRDTLLAKLLSGKLNASRLEQLPAKVAQ